MTPDRVEPLVVIPVRDAADNIEACLDSIHPQVTSIGGELIVVDDGSSDATAALAEERGATVIRMEAPGGPYAARNAGWRAATTRTVVFTDVRNRAETGWLAGLLDALDVDGVAIAGGEIRFGGDGRLAHRLARRSPYADPYLRMADPFMPYVTTSSMAVRRSALEHLGGFDERRSGADAELCWRAQLEGLGSVVVAPQSRMILEPRSSVREIWAQWQRYAHGYVPLRSRFAAHGALLRDPRRPMVVARGVAGRIKRGLTGPDRDLPLELADSVRFVGVEIAYRAALRRFARQP